MNSRIANNLLKQTAVYWGSPVNDGFGKYTYAEPVEIKCCWVDKQEKFLSKNAEELLSQAIVIVDQDVVVGGRLALTTLLQLSSTEVPEDNDALEIKAFQKTPDFKGTTFSRKVWLV